MRRAATLAVVLLLGACSSAQDDPGALSADEKSQLNDAAAMLDANSVALHDAPDNTTQTADDGDNQ